MRDYALETTFDVKFTTRRFSSGAPFALASGVISAYPDNSTTQLTAGITLSADFDGVTGLNNVRVVATAANGYAAGSNYALVITTGTVDSVSVVGEVVAEFSLEAQSPLRPTVALRKLDVSAGGEAGVDWANVGSPTTTVGLSGTTVKTATDVETDTADIQARLPAALSGGNMKTDVLAISGDTTAADNAEAFFDGTGYAGTNNVIPLVTTTTTATTATNVTTVNGLAANVITAASMAADAGAEIADAVWDEAIAGHLSAGTTGLALNSAGSAGDPWATAIPGAYGAGTAGKIVGDNITGNAFTRLGAPAGASVSADIAAVKVDTAAILVDTGTTLDAALAVVDANVDAILVDTAEIGTAGAGLTNINLPNQTMDIVGNITGNLSGSVGSVTGAVGSVTGAVGSVTGNVGGNVVGSVASVTARVTANTDQLAGQTVTAAAGVTFPTSVASPTNITAGVITTVTNLTNAPTSGDLTATMKTSVNAEVLDVLNVDTFAEPAQGAPTATTTLQAKIGYLYKFLRNKVTQTATTMSVFDDAGTTVDQKSTVSDDGTTFTRGEIATGP